MRVLIQRSSAPSRKPIYMPNDIDSPPHYQMKMPNGSTIQAIDYIRATLGDDGCVNYCVGSALKYLSRAGRKQGNAREKDLRKAAWFCIMAAQICEDIGQMAMTDCDDEGDTV
jgi:hypothetical protein